MYSYEWDKKTRGYRLTIQTGNFVASEIRPVFAQELLILQADAFWDFEHDELRPLMWAKQNTYYYKGEECAKAQLTESKQLRLVVSPGFGKLKLQPVDLDAMIGRNKAIMDSLVSDTLKRIKEMYDQYQQKCDVTYIGFSGGKDSMVLLDLCHQVLPLTVPVIFSDTDMELPDSYETWEMVKKRYQGRSFIKVKANKSAVENWNLFGPPSQNLRWCCSVHKSTPAILYLRELTKRSVIKTLAFLGVRADESLRRSSYDDIGEGLKTLNQVNAMPILTWGTHELFLYTFEHNLILNAAYRKGLPRVGCLLCPMSRERQTYLINELYTGAVKPFSDLIRQLISRDFVSEDDAEAFILTGGWHARQSGVSLKEVIPSPSEKRDKDSLHYDFQPVSEETLKEWLKTLGQLIVSEKQRNFTLIIGADFCDIHLEGNDGIVSQMDCVLSNSKTIKLVAKWLKSCIHKSLACVGCRACESECPTGALTFMPRFKVDAEKCIHCMKCHATQDGCMRYFSRRYAGGTTMNISGINKYMTFGLKQEWIEVLADEAENFRSTTALGNRMIPSAVTWFREARLISDSTAIQPTPLLEIVKKQGADSTLLWSLIWIALVNHSPLVKWFVCNAPIGEMMSVRDLNETLASQVNSDSVRKGALQSLCSTIKNSPLGNSTEPLVELEQKGVRVLGLKRMPRSIDPLVVLYSLYLIANVADRTSFTLSEMMTADFDSPYISPLIAFGMSIDELKTQCRGLASSYPQYISCTFTLGLDEIKVFPKEKTLDQILGLILGE